MKGERNRAWAERVALSEGVLAPAPLTRAEFTGMPEHERLDAIRSAAAIPARCGPDIVAAPARGAFAVYSPREMVPGSTARQRHAGFRAAGEVAPRDGIRRADVFDRMEAAALAAHLDAGGDRDDFRAPLSPGQVAMARQYARLVERRAAGGMRCASLEASHAAGGGWGSFSDAFAAVGVEIRRLQERIGDGVALEVRRVRPSARGRHPRGIITDRVLVDQVCLGDWSFGRVLRKHGWSNDGKHREALRRALVAALDRMQGYRGNRPQDVD